jgi:hypothetical protein
MDALTLLGEVLAGLVLAYLLIALLFPEKLS